MSEPTTTPVPTPDTVNDAPPQRRKAAAWPPWRWPLHWQILLGLVLGVVIGIVIGEWAIGEAESGRAGYHDAMENHLEAIVEAGVDDASLDAMKATAGASTDADVALAYQRAIEARVTLDNAAPTTESPADVATSSYAYLFFKLLGDLFLQGLKLIIVPLVVSSIVLAVVNLGRDGLGRLGVKTLAYYLTTSFFAIIVGLVLVNLVQPGTTDAGTGLLLGQPLDAFESDQATLEGKTSGKSATSFLDVFRAMVPPNLFAAATDNGQLLGLIVVAMLVGFFLARLDTESRPVLLQFTQGVHDITMRITEVVLALAPLGVLGLLAATVGEQYAKLVPDDRFEAFATGIVKFAVVALAALLLHFAVTMPLILMLVARVNPLRHYRAMLPALMTAFSTASSSSTLPVTMECVEDRAGVSNKTTSFVLPLGATVNMDGTALYECVAAIFICQAFGVDLSIAQQFLIVVTALLTSIGVAGVPSASLVAIVVILQAVQNNLPDDALPEGVLLVSGMGLLLVFDRPLDMCRTAVNIFSDSVGAVTIAKLQGETGVLER